ncbi:photosystem II oxygen-evolving enhancer protein 2 [Marchantia polymorpha subsp. ruderalis]|uniref:23 kDa subunit of oxygen evolving system of photosystem II n=2 Tax=Marchantia polymorpha TaxID=3197 RepID=A0A176W0G6_MARPO|nr:hypothetical protein AXG93_3817s1310 [Marchantia polymorpha subsp. ruderalis]PTQ32826.1 hypothetical protein MARPO_0094s0007 [Marchantia polymorpha]BBN02703.1 hypothetical protein Mp_2g17390 [Marchantia polymorpha subsp. ruderalis]|eukprot:PTQ32826.1 hypothetical protein MARPO_0094s0007 [Marchantia polymorpha]
MAAVTAASVSVATFASASLSSSRSSVNGVAVIAPVKVAPFVTKSVGVVSCRAESSDEKVAPVSRRLALSLLAGVAAVSSRVNPASAAYGEAANVFGSLKKQSGFIPYSGEGFSVEIPAKWNPSKEIEFPGQVVRYEDNFDATNNLSVSVLKAEKSSIKDYGSPEELLNSLSYLLGKQSYSGLTESEGGFKDNAVSTAAILESEVKESNGKTYFYISVLTRTADGDEGGKHQLIIATIDSGKLYVMKAQAGDKRWFKGAKKFVEGAINSFNVA